MIKNPSILFLVSSKTKFLATVQFKVFYKDRGSILSIKPSTITLNKLKKKIRTLYKMRMDLEYKDSDVRTYNSLGSFESLFIFLNLTKLCRVI